LPGIDIASLIIAILVLLISLTVHEMAHAWTADRLGDPTARHLGRVSLNPIVHIDPIGTLVFPLLGILSGLPVIGWAKPVPVNVARLRRHRRDYVLVAAAGPASNLGLAVVAGAALQLLPLDTAGVGRLGAMALPVAMAERTVQINVLLAVFNMLPIPPLDGGTVLAGVLPRRFAPVVDGLRSYGFVLLYALMLTGTLYRLILPPYRVLVSWLL
jgi:Zn-dependent protease